MYEGKERRRDLIAELRSTHALLQAEQAIKAQEEATLQEHRERQALEAHKRSAATWAMADVQAQNVGSALDYLSKELVRLQEERRIHAFAMLAERERRMREAEEAGRRQLEELRRRQNDEVFRGIVDVHRETIDSYLEDIILDAQEETASDQARLHVREQVSAINRVADELHASGYDQTEVR
jgi:NADH dehydrogenase/NADH:ubiquinone oxidoreductase subunit G